MISRPTRMIASVIGIAIGVLLILFTVGLSNGTMRERAHREANVGAELIFRASGALGFSGSESFRLPVSLAEDLRKVEGVKKVVPIGQISVSAKDSNVGSRLIDGINFDEYAEMAGIKIVEGRSLRSEGDEAIIDTSFQMQKKLKIGDTMQIWERPFTIVGTYEPAAGARVKVPLATMQEQLGGENKCTSFLISINEGFTLEQVAENISEKFPNSQLIPTKDLEELYLNSIPQLNVFLDVIVTIAGVISMLVILLTMYTTVTERTRQIGILKSLGMSKSEIALIITQEALLISFIGVLVGICSTYLLKFILTKTTTLEIEISSWLMLLTLIVAVLGAIVGALYPALKAANLDPVEALSYGE